MQASKSLPSLGRLDTLPRGREAPKLDDADTVALPRLGGRGLAASMQSRSAAALPALPAAPSGKRPAPGLGSLKKPTFVTSESSLTVGPSPSPGGLLAAGSREGGGPSKVTLSLGSTLGGGKKKGRGLSIAKLRQAGNIVKQDEAGKREEDRAAQREKNRAQTLDQYARARRASAEARALLSRGQLSQAEELASRAIDTVPHPEPAMFELRSCIRSRHHRYALALDDALEAQRLPRGARRASARVREARALQGLGKPQTAGAAYLKALELAPDEARGQDGFSSSLHCTQRARFYWQPQRASAEKLFDDEVGRPALRPPGPPRPTMTRTDGGGGDWEVAWLEPLEDGGSVASDEIFSYQLELSYQDDIEHLTAGAQADGWSDWMAVHVCPAGNCPCEAHLAKRGRRCIGIGVATFNLMPGTQFCCRIRGRNGAGLGEEARMTGRTDEARVKLTAAPPPPEWMGVDLSDLHRRRLKEIEQRAAKRASGESADDDGEGPGSTAEYAPAEQFARAHGVWARHVIPIKIAFRYFSVLGVAKSPFLMGMDAFLNFAKDVGCVSKELTNAELQRIFQRANINRIDDVDDDRPNKELEHPEFVNALTRCAHERYPKLRGLDQKTSAFCKEHLCPAVDRLMSDEIGEVLASRLCQAVMRKHRKRLEEVFLCYAAADKRVTSGGVSAQDTINETEWTELVNDAQLIDRDFTRREATLIFVKVNLQDELYVASNFNKPMECTYDEFAQMIGRTVREKVPSSDEPFEATLDTYLELLLLPTFKRIVKDKKKAR